MTTVPLNVYYFTVVSPVVAGGVHECCLPGGPAPTAEGVGAYRRPGTRHGQLSQRFEVNF